jgi:hypothetical protein
MQLLELAGMPKTSECHKHESITGIKALVPRMNGCPIYDAIKKRVAREE